MKSLTVTLVQHSAGQDIDGNLRAIEKQVEATGPVDLIALPEVFPFRGSESEHRASAEPIPGPTTAWLSRLARRRSAWVLGGSLMERDGPRVFNTSVLVNRDGAIMATYRKLHLFEAHLPDGKVIREADMYEAGDRAVTTEVEGWPCGLAICYDLRFPELFRHYAAEGAHILFVPSNFTQRTGRDHWHTLLRARAIENQCFVVAPDQCGENPANGIASYGHSLVVGPWGEPLGDAGPEEGTLSVTLDPELLENTRRRIPALEHRKLDLS